MVLTWLRDRPNKPIRLSRKNLLLLKSCIHSVAAVWLSLTFYFAITDFTIGDPVEYLLHFTGMGAFNLLLITLCVSPVAKRLKAQFLMQCRRLLGLWAFAYAAAHIAVFIAFELQFEWGLVIKEIIDRPYITVGFLALLILTALAVTSFDFIKRKMGKRWQKLHNTVYVASFLVALHFIWSVKSNIVEPVIYFVLLTFLLSLRLKRS